MKILLSVSVFLLLTYNVFSQTVESQLQLRKPGIIASDKVIRICAPSRAHLLNQPKPLYVLFFGKNQWIVKDIPFDSVKLNPKDIKTINVIGYPKATEKYGDYGKNGVVEITMKKESVRIFKKANKDLLKKG